MHVEEAMTTDETANNRCPCEDPACPRPYNGMWTDDEGRVRYALGGVSVTKDALIQAVMEKAEAQP